MVLLPRRRPPFVAENPIKVILKHLEQEPELFLLAEVAPSSVVSTIERCLEKHPADRFQTISELFDSLERVKNGQEPYMVRPGNALQKERETIVWRRIAASAVDGTFMGLSYFFLLLLSIIPAVVVGAMNGKPSDLTWLIPIQRYLVELLFDPSRWFLAGFFDNCLVYPILLWLSDGAAHGLFTEAATLSAPLVDRVFRLWYSFSTICMLFWNMHYRVSCEASMAQATFGKKLAGLRVVAETGKSLTYRQAAIRHFCKMVFLPVLPLEIFANILRWRRIAQTNPVKEAFRDLVLSPFQDRMAKAVVVIRKDRATGASKSVGVPEIEG